MKTLETLEVGDYVKTDNHYRRVLAVLGGEGELRVYVMSVFDKNYLHEDLKQFGLIKTVFELEEGGYVPYTPSEEVTELTVAEAAKRLGVKNLKIVE